MYSSKHYAAKSEKSSIKSEDFAKQSEEFAAQASEATNARWNIFDVAVKDFTCCFFGFIFLEVSLYN